MKHLQKTPCNVQIKTLSRCLEKNYLLQHQTKATTTVETKAQCKVQHQKRKLLQHLISYGSTATSHAVVLQYDKTEHKT
jgi:hypothetical protein